MYTVYVLYSLKFNRTYSGMTIHIDRRIREHNAKRNKSTKAYVPWKIIYKEEYESREKARKKEKYLKSGNGREFIKIIITKWPRGATE